MTSIKNISSGSRSCNTQNAVCSAKRTCDVTLLLVIARAVPEVNETILLGSRGQELVVGRKDDVGDDAGMSCERLDDLARLQIPELHAMSRGQEHVLLVIQLNLLDRLIVSAELAHLDALSDIPLADQTILACRKAAGPAS